METYRIVTLILCILALVNQVITLAAKGLNYQNFKDQDAMNGNTAFLDASEGYIFFPLVASAISIILILVFIIFACREKHMGILEHALFQKFVGFQLAIGACLAAELRNNKTTYDSVAQAFDAMEAAGQTSGATYDLLSKHGPIQRTT